MRHQFKRGAATIALKGPLAHVDHLVSLQSGGVPEGRGAHATLEGLFPRVRPLVLTQTRRR